MSMRQTILFDLDGTLLDTVTDLVYALNVLREERSLPPIPVSLIRPIANLGSREMVKTALDMSIDDPIFPALREQFLTIYDQHLADNTRFFAGVETMLDHLDANDISWGIVTNKLTKQTHSILEHLKFSHRPGVIVCGDTCAKAKPDPTPILHACDKLKTTPAACVFIGDAITDVMAGKAAGTTNLVALYGYIDTQSDPQTWAADGYLQQASDLIPWLAANQRHKST